MVCLSVGCQEQSYHNDPIPEHEELDINSQVLSETRRINVWRPAGSEDKALPVLYMPDGGLQEDFPHIANTLSRLIEEDKIPAVMLVGIENTERRRDLTGSTMVESDKKAAPNFGGSDAFRRFISDELMPVIDGQYQTTDESGVLGESLAGLFVMETFFLEPQLFDRYIAFDPSLWWNDHQLVTLADLRMLNIPDSHLILWFAGSAAKDIQVYTRALSDTLKSVAPQTLTWTYEDMPDEEHQTIFRSAKEKAFIWALNQE